MPRVRGRGATLVLAAFAAVALVACSGSGGGGPGPGRPSENPIQRENRRQGSTGWQFWLSDYAHTDDASGQIKGYASATSVDHGETITLYVSVNPVQPYTIDVYRIGWYGGAGGTLAQSIGPLAGVHQPDCPVDAATGLIACDWAPSAVLTVPPEWTSGVYLAVLRNEQRYASFVVFVVRDDGRAAELLYQQSVTTYQAYNRYPDDGRTGKSLYPGSYGTPTIAGDSRAVAVSFDRPYANDGAGDFLSWEIHFVRWLERAGYDVTYSTDVDTHVNGARLGTVKAFLSVGHDEYWSMAMVDAAERARDAGTSLGFFGANAVFWQVRFEPSASGAPNRIMVCYKDRRLDPVQGATTTVNWRDAPVSRPEQGLIGVQYGDIIAGGFTGRYASFVVANSAHWAYRDTGFADGDAVPGIVGYETDRDQPEFPVPTHREGSRTILSVSPFVGFAGSPAVANAAIYQAPSGAWVFAAGTIGWSLGLDDFGDRAAADPRIQRTTANVLARMLGR